jgi:cyanophycinase
MQSIGGTPIPAIIRARFAAGVTIGGASAGAMAMSQTMIADEVTPDGRLIHGPPAMEGLGLWPEAIVSAHFTERRRLNSLAQILGSYPALFGVGIDEGTAAIVSNGEIEVLGSGTVVIVSPGNARTRTLNAGAHFRYASLPH